MSQLSELGLAQNRDLKGKVHENGFASPTAPTQSESLHGKSNNMTPIAAIHPPLSFTNTSKLDTA